MDHCSGRALLLWWFEEDCGQFILINGCTRTGPSRESLCLIVTEKKRKWGKHTHTHTKGVKIGIRRYNVTNCFVPFLAYFILSTISQKYLVSILFFFILKTMQIRRSYCSISYYKYSLSCYKYSLAKSTIFIATSIVSYYKYSLSQYKYSLSYWKYSLPYWKYSLPYYSIVFLTKVQPFLLQVKLDEDVWCSSKRNDKSRKNSRGKLATGETNSGIAVNNSNSSTF